MLIIAAALLLATPPADFAVEKHSVTIGTVVWYDATGEKHTTEEPYLLIRMKVTNKADHPLRWQGFRKARVKYGQFYGSAVLVHSFGPGTRLENSLAVDQMVKPGQVTSTLLVFDMPKQWGPASLTVQWNGEQPGWVMTVKNGFILPKLPKTPPSAARS